MGDSESIESQTEYSFHALERMSERHVTQQDVLETLQFGQKRPGKNDLRIAEHELDSGIRLRVIYDDGIRNGSRFVRIVTVIYLGSRK